MNEVFIVGGGNSLKDFDFNCLKDKQVITINKAILKTPFAQFFYFQDFRFYQWMTEPKHQELELIEAFKNYKGITYSIAPKITDKRINILKPTSKIGFETTPGLVKHGGNSGYAAINLAYHLGFRKIILLGYDMKKIDNQTHFHNGYPIKQTDSVYKNFIKPFEWLAKHNDYGLTIINTSMDSDLTCFPKQKINDLI